MSPVLFELRNLKKVYDGRTVLDLERVCLDRGKIISLLGPNGAGKTTLLEIMAFLSSPSSGEVWFDQKKVDFTAGKLIHLRRKVVLVEQQSILFTTKVWKNVAFPLRIRGTPKARRERIVEELLDLVGMGGFRHAKAHKLSGGETQRVAIARALACFPEVILLDEPTANVDVENQIAIERIIQEINQAKGISVIFTTHNMIQASKLADETVFLYEGKAARSIYENIFSGHIEMDRNGCKRCVLQQGLSLGVDSEKSGPVRIAVDPNAVKISQSRSNGSMENTFQGKLIQLTDEQRRVRILVDVGIPLSVLMSKEGFGSLGLGMGDDIWLTCPKASIRVF
ncbi:MAG: ATP-binding cassette domain-containing protein [Deltaproteobacteria bacterium]|jgi:tungstate transport system ATP-binding protein